MAFGDFFANLFHRVLSRKKDSGQYKKLNDRLFLQEKHSCPVCHTHLEYGQLADSLLVCPACSYHFRMTPAERIKSLLDNGVFDEFCKGMTSTNPLDFPGYDEKLREHHEKSSLDEAVVTGTGSINGRKCVIAIMAFQFLGGSMGSVVGEKITRSILLGARLGLPVIIFTASGGARMYEGILSLMQMAKTSNAAALLEKKGFPLFIVLTDPTTGGVTASYAMLGNVILAEPQALVGFAGTRVIDTIKLKLPPGFQRSEFLLAKGFVDMVIERKNLRKVLSFLIDTHVPSKRKKIS